MIIANWSNGVNAAFHVVNMGSATNTLFNLLILQTEAVDQFILMC